MRLVCWTISERVRRNGFERQAAYGASVALHRCEADQAIARLEARNASNLASYLTGALSFQCAVGMSCLPS